MEEDIIDQLYFGRIVPWERQVAVSYTHLDVYKRQSLETQGTQVWNSQNPFEIKRLAIACYYVPKKNHIEDIR